MGKIGYQERNSMTLPVAMAVIFSGTMLLPADAAPSQNLQPPSLTCELPPLVMASPTEPELSWTEERSMIYRVMKEVKAEQEKLEQQKLEQEAKVRQEAIKATSKLKAAKVRAPKTVSRNMTTLPSLAGNTMLNYALSFKGVPYRYGGTNPATGLDCSAFTQLVFASSGVELPRTASMQFRMGEGIAQSGLQPGDLVFFSTNGPGASHVGIFLGEGQFISTTNKGVSVQDMNDNYWGKYYRGARRVR
ncbi:MAG TPA: NlpC/P60 family protein [Candidatus Deferrimicrobium sp.]|nr:NlpC/P60 family protein [Candidatus Deferrimicrobium sp.]